MVDEKAYAYENPVCKFVTLVMLYVMDITLNKLIGIYGTVHNICVRMCFCKSCGKYFQTEFFGENEAYSNFSNETNKKVKKTYHELNKKQINEKVDEELKVIKKEIDLMKGGFS